MLKWNSTNTNGNRKIPKKTLLHHLGKLQGKSGQSLSLDISGKKGRRVSCFFPISQSWETDTKNSCSLSTEQPAQATHYSHLSESFQKLSHSVFVLHSFYNKHHYRYNQEGKTIYILKICQAMSAFKIVILGHMFTSPLIQKFFEMIQ